MYKPSSGRTTLRPPSVPLTTLLGVALLLGACESCPKWATSVGLCGEPPPPPEDMDLICDASKGSTCNATSLGATLDVDGGAVIWALGSGELHEVVTPGRIYTGSGDDKLMMSLEFGMSTKFIDDLRENVKRGLRAKASQGWLTCRAPHGYFNDRNTKTIVPDPDRFELIRRAWQLVARGLPPTHVLAQLNGPWGFRTQSGRLLSRSTMYAMLKNPFYAGTFVTGGEVYEGKHEPMVTQAEFKAVQRQLGREGRPRMQRHSWALTGLLTCGSCRGTLSATIARKRTGERYPYYFCHSGTRQGLCHEPYGRADQVEAQLAEFLDRLTIPPHVLAWMLERLDRLERERGRTGASGRRQRAQTRVQVEQQLIRLAEMRTRDEVGSEEYLTLRRLLIEQRQSLATPRLASTPFEPARQTLSLLGSAKEKFLNGDAMEKRMIAESVCSNLQLRNKKLLCIAKKPFALVLANGSSPGWLGGMDSNHYSILQRDESCR